MVVALFSCITPPPAAGGCVSNVCPVGSVTCGSGYGNDSGGDAVGGGNGSISGDSIGGGTGNIDAGLESFSPNGFFIVDGIIASSVLMERKVTFLLSNSESFCIVLVLITFSEIFDDDDEEDEVINRVCWELFVEEELLVQETGE